MSKTWKVLKEDHMVILNGVRLFHCPACGANFFVKDGDSWETFRVSTNCIGPYKKNKRATRYEPVYRISCTFCGHTAHPHYFTEEYE